MKNQATLVVLTCIILTFAMGSVARNAGHAQAQNRTAYFPETGHTVKGKFLDYWQAHGGLAQQGYPLSEELQEISDTDGRTYTMQYFERAVFEMHPENRAPYDVLLTLLGNYEYARKYPNGAPGASANHDRGTVLFPQTGKHLGGGFHYYWQTHGGLAQQGYPISEEFVERSELDGKLYTVQYFERAVFEYHPENRGTPYEVLLSQLGTFRHRARYSNLQPLTIPAPSLGGVQSGPRGSERFLVWHELSLRQGSGSVPGSGDIMGLDLVANKPVTITNTPGEQTDAAISGSVVVWKNNNASCEPCGPAGIQAKDLISGDRYTVVAVSGDKFVSTPAISGKTVIWLEYEANRPMRLRAKNLGSQDTLDIAVAQPSTYFSGPRISDEYIVWYENSDLRKNDSYLKAYNRMSREIKNIFTYKPDVYGTRPQLEIDGYLLAWSFAKRVNLTNLRNGTTQPLPLLGSPPSPVVQSIKNGIITWLPDPQTGKEIHGSTLGDITPHKLVAEAEHIYNSTIAGSWLVWSVETGPQSAVLRAASLGEVFAKAEQPVSPAPLGTEALFDVEMISANEGWAVGSDGVILRYSTGKWEEVSSPVRTKGALLTAVDMMSATDGWAVGYYVTPNIDTEGIVLRYKGGRWEKVTNSMFLNSNMVLWDVDMISADEVWVVGGSSSVTPLTPIILHYKDGKWQDELREKKADIVGEIDMISSSEGWAGGGYGTIWHYTEDKWEEVETPLTPRISSVQNLDMVSTDEGWITDDGTFGILHYAHGQWVPASLSGSTELFTLHIELTGLQMVSPVEGWAVGRRGHILHNNDGTWRSVESPLRVQVDLLGLDMVSPVEGWAVGTDGTILHCQNGKWSIYSR